MASELLPDGLWELVEPLIPARKAKPSGGRPRLRACLRRILALVGVARESRFVRGT